MKLYIIAALMAFTEGVKLSQTDAPNSLADSQATYDSISTGSSDGLDGKVIKEFKLAAAKDKAKADAIKAEEKVKADAIKAKEDKAKAEEEKYQTYAKNRAIAEMKANYDPSGAIAIKG